MSFCLGVLSGLLGVGLAEVVRQLVITSRDWEAWRIKRRLRRLRSVGAPQPAKRLPPNDLKRALRAVGAGPLVACGTFVDCSTAGTTGGRPPSGAAQAERLDLDDPEAMPRIPAR